MRIQIIFIFLCVVLSFNVSLSAQQSYSPHTQYLYNPYMFNPARAGFGEGHPRVFLDYRRQWVEMPNSPDTKILTADARLSLLKDLKDKKRNFHNKVGLGGIFYQDNTFVINRVGGLLSYAYHFLPPSKEDSNHKHQFSIGLSSGFLYQGIDYSEVRTQDMDDEVLFTDDVGQTVFDLGFGMAYRYKNTNKRQSFRTLDVDLSVPHAPNSKIRYFDNNENSQTYQLLTHFLGSVNTEFQISSANDGKFHIKPGFMVKATSGNPVQFDFSLITRYDDIVWFGGGAKFGAQENESPVLGYFTTVGLQVMKSASIYYNFEFRNDHNSALGYSHEIAIGYTFGRKFKKRFDELQDTIKAIQDTISVVKDTIKVNRNNIAKNDSSIIENDRDIDAIIASEFKVEYLDYRRGGGLYNFTEDKKELRDISTLDFTDVERIKLNVQGEKIADVDRIYIVVHYFEREPDLSKEQMIGAAYNVKEELIEKLKINPYHTHIITVIERDEDYKNHISILGRVNKKK